MPLSSTSFADDDVATVRTYRELSGKLPSFVERLGTVASASCVPVADSKDAWVDATEHWGADPAEKCRGVGTVNVDGAFTEMSAIRYEQFVSKDATVPRGSRREFNCPGRHEQSDPIHSEGRGGRFYWR